MIFFIVIASFDALEDIPYRSEAVMMNGIFTPVDEIQRGHSPLCSPTLLLVFALEKITSLRTLRCPIFGYR